MVHRPAIATEREKEAKMALSSETKVEEVEGGKVVQFPKGAEKAKDEEEDKPKAVEFANLSDATRQLVRSLDAEDRARAKRKKVGDDFRDRIKQAEDKLTSAIDGARASALKDAGLEIGKTKERATKARVAGKEARAAFAALAADDDGDIGKAFKRLEKLKTERAEAKASAGEAIKRASGRAELLRYSIHEAAGQLRLDL